MSLLGCGEGEAARLRSHLAGEGAECVAAEGVAHSRRMCDSRCESLPKHPGVKSWKKFTRSGHLVGLGDQGESKSQGWEDEREGTYGFPQKGDGGDTSANNFARKFGSMLRWLRKRVSR